MAHELFKTGSTFTVTDEELGRVADKEGRTFQGDPDTTYTVQYFTADDANRLNKQATTQKYNPATQRMETEFDGLAYALSILDHVIQGWTGIVRDGVPLDCILANKRILPANRRERLLILSQENVQVKAAEQAASFRPVASVL
jgi:hypothetical protein